MATAIANMGCLQTAQFLPFGYGRVELLFLATSTLLVGDVHDKNQRTDCPSSTATPLSKSFTGVRSQEKRRQYPGLAK